MSVAEAAKLALARLRKEEAAKLVPVDGIETEASKEATNNHFQDSVSDLDDIKQFAQLALERIRNRNV